MEIFQQCTDRIWNQLSGVPSQPQQNNCGYPHEQPENPLWPATSMVGKSMLVASSGASACQSTALWVWGRLSTADIRVRGDCPLRQQPLRNVATVFVVLTPLLQLF